MNSKLFGILLTLLLLSACQPENELQAEVKMTVINLDELETDTDDWNDYCLGYHTLKIPLGLTASTNPSTHIDWRYPNIIHNYPASALDYIENHARFGGVVFQTQVNGWNFVVAKERRSAIRVSTRGLVFFGAKKMNNDIIVFTEDASVSRVGDGSDAKYRLFYKMLDVEPVTPQNRKRGFCYDGYVFSGYTPANIYTFSTSFTSLARHGYRVNLSQEMKAPPKNNRLLAPESPPVIPASIQVTESVITKGGYNGVITRVLGVGEEADQGYLKVLIEGPYGNLGKPVIASSTISEIKQDIQQKEYEFLAFLANIQAN